MLQINIINFQTKYKIASFYRSQNKLESFLQKVIQMYIRTDKLNDVQSQGVTRPLLTLVMQVKITNKITKDKS